MYDQSRERKLDMRRGSYDFATTGDNPHPLKILTKEVRREWIGGREFRRVICRPKRNCVIVDVDYLIPLGSDGNWDYNNTVLDSIGVKRKRFRV